MGTFIRKENILNSRNNSIFPKDLCKRSKKIKSIKKVNTKNKVLIDGIMINRNRRVTICVKCVKTICNSKKHFRRLCTNAGFWVDIKKKYSQKIMGKYRLSVWVRKNYVEITGKNI